LRRYGDNCRLKGTIEQLFSLHCASLRSWKKSFVRMMELNRGGEWSEMEELNLIRKAFELAGSKRAFWRECLFHMGQSPNTTFIEDVLDGKRRLSRHDLELVLDYLKKHRLLHAR